MSITNQFDFILKTIWRSSNLNRNTITDSVFDNNKENNSSALPRDLIYIKNLKCINIRGAKLGKIQGGGLQR